MGQALLKEVPRLKECPQLSGEGEYDHMEFIRGIDMIKEDFELPDKLVTARFNTLFTRSAHRWYVKLRQAHGHQIWAWWKTQIINKLPIILAGLKLKQPFNLPNLMLIKTKLYHGFAHKKTDYQHCILTCQNL
ncbi:hypothetical protein O181_094286 [Austropuccinia psidii MF-1]|uniref:Uncharacterized protein n=1 Tax=Austropuccinia psidii MF-1 TaxID=1389203 RepID=A0A9Q3PC97_9BASI|nr:hypothetical protein [Austropuccinia psidii MF-1]